jgi:hypothetical protein
MKERDLFFASYESMLLPAKHFKCFSMLISINLASLTSYESMNSALSLAS